MKTKSQNIAAIRDSETTAVNIGPRERLKRRVMGIVFLAVSAGLAFSMVAYDAPRLFRAAVFFPLWMAGLGLFQASGKT